MIQYPGWIQTATATTMGWESLSQSMDMNVAALYLRAMIDPESHLILDCTINSVKAHSLIDSGATGIFVNPQFIKECHAEIRTKAVPREVRVIDGRMINSGLITKEAILTLCIGQHQETLVADITNTGKYPCILGTPWLGRHDPTIRWAQKTVTFDSKYCRQACLQDGAGHRNKVTNRLEPTSEAMIGPWKIGSKDGRKEGKGGQWTQGKRAPKYSMVTPAAFRLSAKDAELYALEVTEVLGTTEEVQIPMVYQDLSGAFSEEASNELPNHGPSDMKIEFKEGQEPKNTRLRPMSPAELEELRRYLEENLSKGWIRRSKSSVSAPIVFARKKDGSIRVCIDYRNLNKVTVRNRYPLPLIPELTDRLVGATIFSKLDVRQAYHRIRMAPGHEFKTTFKTRYGLFEYLVMSFGLTNAPT